MSGILPGRLLQYVPDGFGAAVVIVGSKLGGRGWFCQCNIRVPTVVFPRRTAGAVCRLAQDPPETI